MHMEYRILPHGGERISVIGLGTSSLGEADEQEIIETVRMALDHGINYIDMASGHAATFSGVGKAIAERRDQVYLQIHFGADYTSGEYGWTTDPKKIKAAVAWQLDKLQTDHIDFGFIHCIDEESDLRTVQENGIIDAILELKRKGAVRHIGLSSHTPALVNKVLDMGILDMVMFSINPAYDNRHGEYAYGEADERFALYQRCAKEGVGISVMKPFCGGQLLDAAKSVFPKALSKIQCLQYALDQPGVITVLPGVRDRRDLRELLAYCGASQQERDYSVLAQFDAVQQKGRCVYCRHCHPCPAGLDIALIHKYHDLAVLGDGLAADHYHHLDKKASDCIRCGHCSSRCPFGADPMKKMEEIKDYFGE